MNTIIRGTNGMVRYKVKTTDLSTVGSIEMHIAQGSKEIIKYRDDLTVDVSAGTISYELTQEESLSLVPYRTGEVSVLVMVNGKRGELPTIKFEVNPTRKNEVMV